MALILEQQDLEKFRSGDDHVFTRVFNHYYENIYKIGYYRLGNDPDDAKELTIRVFTKLWQIKETVNDQTHLEKLLYTVFWTTLTDDLRMKERQRMTNISLPENIENVTPALQINPEHDAILLEMTEQLQAGGIAALEEMEGMSHQCIEVFRMRILQKRTREEVAALFGISIKTVDNHIAYARKILSTALRKRGFDFLPIILGGVFCFF
jgi:RNA polymerase sigma-70 factor (ECF subfamily)